jgi:hypothetical protein
VIVGLLVAAAIATWRAVAFLIFRIVFGWWPWQPAWSGKRYRE